MLKINISRFLFIFLLVLLGFPIMTLAREFQDQPAYYIEKYGRANPQHDEIKRVYAIFERVRAVADKHQQRWPQLIVVQTAPHSFAIALPDGHIIISAATIQAHYKNVSEIQGDTRLAFILGHELAHLANNDFWHREISQFAADEILKSAIQLEKEALQQQELAADDAGFLYAALAGYPVPILLEETNKKNNFFQLWEEQPWRALVGTHPDNQVRVRLLKERLQRLLEQSIYFHFGVRLSHFNRCEDAIYFFKSFQQQFPSREVFNNLGFCYLQLAQRELGEKAWLYWLPMQLEIDSRIDQLFPGTLRGENSPLADTYLSQARQAFEHASQMDAHDANTWLNLAITFFYQKEIFLARAAIEKARTLSPNNLNIQGLRALIIADEGFGTDTWSQAIVLLEELLKTPDVSPLWLYNTAQLLRQRGRTVPELYWQRLAANRLPPPIQRTVCAQISCLTQTRDKTIKQAEELLQLPIKLGSYLRRDPEAQAHLAQASRFDFDWQKAVYGTLYQMPQQEVLVLAGYVEMIVLHKPAVSVSQLQETCPFPLQKTEVVQGHLLHCENWSVLERDQNVQQIWFTASYTQ